MYRIEVSPGEETVLRTIEELATAIRNGLVTPRSRVYHNASQKWLPIEFHPHYKKALALPERPKSAPVTTPLPGALPSFAIKREPPPTPEPVPAPPPVAAPPTPVAEAPVIPPRPARRSYPLPAAAENLPFIEVEEPPPAPPVAAAPPPCPAATTPEPAPAPMPAPEPAPAPAPVSSMGPDAFPTLAQPRSYLPPVFESEPVRSSPPAIPAPMPSAAPVPAAALVPAAAPLFVAAPTSQLPVASRRARGGRPVLVGAGALVLVVAGYLFMTSSPSSQVAAESVPAAEQQKASPKPSEEEVLPPEDTDIPVPQPSAITSAPARSGPPSQAWSSSSGATAPLLPTGPGRSPKPAAANPAIGSAPEISPPPVNVELAVPKLPAADSLAPAKAQRDTAAIKRILKAVGGQ
ncbi:MAG: hypothetical protein ACAI18_01040 [Gemmatimonadales bacterium]